AQLQRYAIALDNPPLLIVSDIGTTIRIHTNWTNSVSKVYEIAIADLSDPEKRGWLKAALSDPETLRPSKTRQQLRLSAPTRSVSLSIPTRLPQQKYSWLLDCRMEGMLSKQSSQARTQAIRLLAAQPVVG